MKKTIILALAALTAFSACSKVQTDSVGDNSFRWTEAQSYMMYIVDDLATDVLDAAEKALLVNRQEVPYSTQFKFDGPFDQAGSVWTVTGADSPLKGMSLTCLEAGKWQAVFKGNYAFDQDVYPTEFTMALEKGDLHFDYHYDWTISLSGTRTEREGYGCTFGTEPSVVYGFSEASAGFHGWDRLVGKYSLVVYRQQEAIDIWLLTVQGPLASAEFIRQL